MPVVYLVDVCGTIVRDDTTLGLLEWHFARRAKPLRRLAVRAIIARASPVRLAVAVIERLSGKHLTKLFLLGMLKGEEPDELSTSAQDYVRFLLAERKVEAIWSILENRPAGSRLVLVSGSIEPVVAALAKVLDAQYLSSTLGEAAGRLTGKLDWDLTARKPEALRARFGSELEGCRLVAISDNLSDRNLFEMAHERVIVVWKDKHRRAWSGFAGEMVKP